MSALSLQPIRERLATPLFGYGFTETLSGSHRLIKGKKTSQEQAFSCHLRAEALPGRQWIDLRQGRIVLGLSGTVQADGLSKQAKLSGELTLNLRGERGVRYTFTFRGGDRLTYQYDGHKTLSLRAPWKSLTTLYGNIYQKRSGKKVSEGIAYFDREQLLPWFRSFYLSFQH